MCAPNDVFCQQEVSWFTTCLNYMSLRFEFRVVMSVTISAYNDVRFVFTSSCL